MPRQKGSALLLALLIMAFITSIAVITGDDLQRSLFRNQTLQGQTEAKWALLGNEVLILSQLTEHLSLSNAIYRPGTVNEIRIEYRLRDLNSCFNLNALQRVSKHAGTLPAGSGSGSESGSGPESVGPTQTTPEKSAEKPPEEPYPVTVLTQLIKHATGLDDEAAQKITSRIVGWVNPEVSSAQEKENNKPALLLDLSELRIIPGVELMHYRQLRPWLCVLPQAELKININALNEKSAPLLSALTAGKLSISNAKLLIASRPPQGWDKPEAITAWLSKNNLSAAENMMPFITLSANYLLLSQWTVQEDQRYALHSLIQYGKEPPQVVQRKYGISDIN